MRRVAVLMVVIALLSGVFAVSGVANQSVREATPEVDRVPATPVTALPAWDPDFGIVIEELASGEPVSAAGSALRLFRVTITPGGAIPDQFHPGPAVLYIESGTIAVTTLAEPLSYREACVGACPRGTPPATTMLGIDETVVLGPGSSVFVDEGTGYYAIATDDAPVVVLMSGTFDTSQPVFQFPLIAEACAGGC